ncbi:pentatricopeptide repeat-containing protein At1g59720, chloroplastic/mitochondrial, partial [Cajanus cajan]|uniref:pentatricopeptide repeat-containing protein At1g59720, chloroplastic/mitochondrial n=1 Tax=Cajanus cajan TaxID=3821 RepID=UPI00098D7C62
MDKRNEVSWNIMIDSYEKSGKFDIALRMFCEMQEVHDPDGYTMQSVVSACAGLGALSLGLWAHAYVLKKCDKNVASDVLVNNCLVDMYCKCGSLEIAKQVFECMPLRDVNSWNSMILGFAMHGEAEAALEYYDRMVKVEKVIPNSITFVGVLSA